MTCRRLLLVSLLLVLALVAARGVPEEGPIPPQSATPLKKPAVGPAAPAVRFEDITAAADIRFLHNNGANGKKYLPETMGSGCAFLDYDGDGFQDILLLNGRDWPGSKQRDSFPALYRNNRNGTFTEVTARAGLRLEMYAMGCAIGDYDNNGYPDIYVSGLGSEYLFRNNGDGTFKDRTADAGLGSVEFGASSAWLDYDRDGRLDLFVTHYVQWSQAMDIYCTLDGVHKSYCTPESYKGSSSRLYHNAGNGRLTDVTRAAGLWDPTNKGLGVAVLDFDGDGWPDIAVANDTQPNKLYRNQGNGAFGEMGIAAGMAYSEDGVARAGMGIDAADYDHSGRPSLVIGNFSNEMLGLYHNEGHGLFIDEASATGVGQASLLTLAFGCFFFDFDLDGYLDIFVANGHVESEINRVQPRVHHAEPPHLFWNRDGQRFEEVTTRAGESLSRPAVARGAAFGDIDNDGDMDLLISANQGPARLFRNQGGNSNNWLGIRLRGRSSNRDGLGALLTAQSGSVIQTTMVRSGSSYLSQSQLPIVFGLGTAARVDRLSVSWPSGIRQEFDNLICGRYILIDEKEGLAK